MRDEGKSECEIPSLYAKCVEVVRLTFIPSLPTAPVWPDDQITRDWLAGISAARETADPAPDPWDEPIAGQL
jgi:hypothetical protein